MKVSGIEVRELVNTTDVWLRHGSISFRKNGAGGLCYMGDRADTSSWYVGSDVQGRDVDVHRSLMSQFCAPWSMGGGRTNA
jgi:hypothetical protein